jgi:YHS domain-containing protein
MKVMNALAVAGMVATLAVSGFAAAPSHMAKMHSARKPATKKVASLVCPVTGEKIASIKDAQGHSTYKGKTYYFCCPSCKPMFDKNPAKYAK